MRCSKTILLSALLLASNSAFSATTTVYPGSGLQAAIAAASEGDTILLESGLYTNSDSSIEIGVSLTIKAASAAVSPIIQDSLVIPSTISIDKLSIQGIQVDKIKVDNNAFINTLDILESKLVNGRTEINSSAGLRKFNMIASTVACSYTPGGSDARLSIYAGDIVLAGNSICQGDGFSITLASTPQGEESITVVGNTFTQQGLSTYLQVHGSSEVLIAANRFIKQWTAPGSTTLLNENSESRFILNNAIKSLTVKNNIFTAQTDRLQVGSKLKRISPVSDMTNTYFENNLVDAGNIDIWAPAPTIGLGEQEQEAMMQSGNVLPLSVKGNIFINYKDNILPLAATSLDFDAQNNLCFNNSENCGTTNGNLDVDPLLVGSYKLAAGSPAIDAGPVDAVLSDLDGSRNNMGPYGGSWSIDQYDAQRDPGAVGPYIYPIVDAAKGAANGDVKVKFVSFGRLL